MFLIDAEESAGGCAFQLLRETCSWISSLVRLYSLILEPRIITFGWMTLSLTRLVMISRYRYASCKAQGTLQSNWHFETPQRRIRGTSWRFGAFES